MTEAKTIVTKRIVTLEDRCRKKQRKLRDIRSFLYKNDLHRTDYGKRIIEIINSK